MNVRVRDGLAGRRAIINADVESGGMKTRDQR